MIVPIGVDCEIAHFLQKYNLRNVALPFDWTVTYNGVSRCIADEFGSFTEPLNDRVNTHDVYFIHDFHTDIPRDKEKYDRRCRRLIEILETSTEEVIFCRKGHACHHHYEHNGRYSHIVGDIDDAENLDLILRTKYPRLNYKIIVILVCDKCYNPSEMYNSKSDKIVIYNLATGSTGYTGATPTGTTPQADPTPFENLLRSVFKV